MIPSLDLRKRLRAARGESETEERIIIVDIDGVAAGFIVDKASELLRVSDNEIDVVDIDEIVNGEILCGLDRVIELLSSHGAVDRTEALSEA